MRGEFEFWIMNFELGTSCKLAPAGGKTDDLEGRYGASGKDSISPVRDGGNIVDIKTIERKLAEKIPGKDNKEHWAGAKKGEPLSPEAQKAYDKMLEIQKEHKNNCKKWQK